MRNHAYSRDVKAACSVCHGDEAHWFGGQAQGTAALHTDRTGHETWVEVYMHIRYTAGRPAATAVPVKSAAASFVGLAPKPRAPR